MQIRIDASMESELNFDEIELPDEPVTWLFDIGEYRPHGHASYVQALEHFCDTVYSGASQEIILLQSSPERDYSTLIDQLVACLPDDLEASVHFDVSGMSKAKAAMLTSPERYPWVNVVCKPRIIGNSSLGVLFPIEDLCTPETLEKFDELFGQMSTPYRIVYEATFTESWNGLDEVVVLPETLSSLGKRRLLGFCAAGGVVWTKGDAVGVPGEKIFGVEGFEPPTFWSQTRRASQAALYPE